MAACKACYHKDRAEIDRQIVAGVPLRAISARFHLSLGGLHRHKNHVREILAQAAHRESPERGSALLDRVEKLVAAAEEIVAAARAKNDFRGANGALGAAAKLLALLGQLSGELQAANSGGGIHFHASKTVNINLHDSDLEVAVLVGEATGNFSLDEFMRLKALALGDTDKLLCSTSMAPQAENMR